MLGADKCDCKTEISPSAFVLSKSSMKPDRRKVCIDFCRYHRVTLRGCSDCSPQLIREYENERKIEKQKEKKESGERVNIAEPPRIPLAASPPAVFHPVPQRFQAVGSHALEATTDSTAPDWNRVCGQLCRNGSGGLLCNCDLPPF